MGEKRVQHGMWETRERRALRQGRGIGGNAAGRAEAQERQGLCSGGWGAGNDDWRNFLKKYLEDHGRKSLLAVGKINYKYGKKKTKINPEVSHVNGV